MKAPLRIKSQNIVGWESTGVFICSNDVKDIQFRLIEISISAPFRVAALSRHLQILTWTDNANIQEITTLVKQLDD